MTSRSTVDSLIKALGLALALAVVGCQRSSHGSTGDGPDTSTSTASDSETETDSSGIGLVEIVKLGDDARHVSIAYSGTHIAIGYGNSDDSDPEVSFAVFPWDDPSSAAVEPLPFPCDLAPNHFTRLFPVDEGFAVYTTSRYMNDQLDGCDSSRVVMGLDAQPADGPYPYPEGFYFEYWPAWQPDGVLDDQGDLLTAQVWGIEGDTDPDQVVFRLDRLGTTGGLDNLIEGYFEWPFVDPNGGVRNSLIRNYTFESQGVLASVAFDYRWVGVHELVLATGTADGEVVLPPSPVTEIPGNPETTSHLDSAFAQRGDELVGVTIHWNTEEGDSFTRGESIVFDFDGELVKGPTDIPYLSWDKENTALVQIPGLAWSGTYFGFCYHVWKKGYELLVLDENADPVAEPVELVTHEGQPVMTGRCDIADLDGDSFAVVMSVRDSVVDDDNGLYLAYVNAELME